MKRFSLMMVMIAGIVPWQFHTIHKTRHVFEPSIEKKMDNAYFNSLSAGKKATIMQVVASMQKQGITNKFIQAGILAVCSKESNFELNIEKGYGGTSAARIRKVFGKRLSAYTDEGIDTLKRNDIDFFDAVYGGQWGAKNLGNTQSGDGYKYRGRGINQVTGRGNYTKFAKLSGHDIANHPELMETMPVAIDVMISYFVSNIGNMGASQHSAYQFTHINDFKNTLTAAKAAYNANAGIGKTPEQCAADTTGGYKLTILRVDGFLGMVGGA